MSSDVETTRGTATQTVLQDRNEHSLVVGVVVVEDQEGREISRITTAVFGDDWIALPVWSLLGGKNLAFQSQESEEILVEMGDWATGDPIILLKLEFDQTGKTPKLFPWIQYSPLEWRSFINKDAHFQVDIASPEKRGRFLSFPLPYEIQEPGVFMQEGHVVGWAFPDQLDYGYLWAGPEGADLSPDVRMNQFYQFVLTDWRETHIHNVLNMEERIPAVKKLEIFAEGLRMDSRFSEEDVPPQLSLQSIVAQMHSLASELIEYGQSRDVMRILDEHIIIDSQDLTLVKDSVLARVESEDYNRAIQFLERIKINIFKIKGQAISGLDQFHAQLYKDWLRKILDQGSYYSGMVAFEQARRIFPDDIELHLLGVEVALSEKNWTRARGLLRMRDYPETMREWVSGLENEIQEKQENEEAVTIRFNPGASHIPVNVYLNGSHSFRFIIDTGATICSIPSSAIDKLRIDIDQTTPNRLISTAGGIAETYEVKLKSIELGGFRISGVEALIIDIPGYRDHGLLGQNFLNHFHIEIDNQKGILRLKKR
jgi:clan AA aspartic protease (TIGR02281 family)